MYLTKRALNITSLVFGIRNTELNAKGLGRQNRYSVVELRVEDRRRLQSALLAHKMS